MDQAALTQSVKSEEQAVRSTDEATSPPVVLSDGHPPIRYATDAEVDEAMEKIFEWHSPLLKKLAE